MWCDWIDGNLCKWRRLVGLSLAFALGEGGGLLGLPESLIT